MKYICLFLVISVPLSLHARHEAYYMDAKTKVIYSQQLNPKNNTEIVNVVNSGSIISVSKLNGKDVTGFVTGPQDIRDIYAALITAYPKAANSLNKGNQIDLEEKEMLVVEQVKGHGFQVTGLESIDRSGESNKDNDLGRNPKKDAFAFFKEQTVTEYMPPETAPPTTIPTGTSSSTLSLPTHPAQGSSTTQESNRSGEAGLDVSNAQEAINNALDNPTQSINIGDVYKSVGQK